MNFSRAAHFSAARQLTLCDPVARSTGREFFSIANPQGQRMTRDPLAFTSSPLTAVPMYLPCLLC